MEVEELITEPADNSQNCEVCGSKLVHIEGCLMCVACGWSPCD